MEERRTGDNLGDWYYNANPYYHRGYGLPNCTAYVWGRLSELTGQPCTVPNGNAIMWADKPQMKKINYPVMGSCIIWSGGIYDAYGRLCGHIGVVEHVYSDGSIDVSMSSYGDYVYRLYRLYPNDGYHIPDSYNLTFHGFYMYDGVQEVIDKEEIEWEIEQIHRYATKVEAKEQLEKALGIWQVKPTNTKLKEISQDQSISQTEIYCFPWDSSVFVLLFLVISIKKIIEKTTIN